MDCDSLLHGTVHLIVVSHVPTRYGIKKVTPLKLFAVSSATAWHFIVKFYMFM